MNAALMLALLAATAGMPDGSESYRRRRPCPPNCPMCSADPPLTTRTLFDGDRLIGWTVWRRDGALDTQIATILDDHADIDDIAGLHSIALQALYGFCDDAIEEDCEGHAMPEVSRVHGVSLGPSEKLSTTWWDYEEQFGTDGMLDPPPIPFGQVGVAYTTRWGRQKKHADPAKKAARKAAQKAKRANRGRR